jgi:periplasmic divalent cation tolerance protein
MPEEHRLPDAQSHLVRFVSPLLDDQPSDACCVVLVTCPSSETARSISRALVTARLAACVNVVSGVTSIYEWDGAVCEEAEVLLLVKTQMRHIERLYQQLKTIHPYTVPEFIVLPWSAGSEPYINWLRRATL